MTHPNRALWEQAVADENWPEAEHLQRIAEGAGPAATGAAAQVELLPVEQEWEDLWAAFEHDTSPTLATPPFQQTGKIEPDWDALDEN